MELPNYFNYWSAIYPMEVVEALVAIESSLRIINYTKHFDLIDAVFTKEGEDELKSLCDVAMGTLRDHVTDALHMQGITLTNGDEIPIITMAQILNGVVALSKQSIVDIADGEPIEEGETDLEYVCNVLAITTGISAVNLLLFIDSIDPHVVEVLKAGELTNEVHKVNNLACMKRFKRYWEKEKVCFPTDADGNHDLEMIKAIKDLGYFGYNAKTMLQAIDNLIEHVNDERRVRAEITLCILGSSMSDPDEMLAFAEEAVETIFSNHLFVLKVNAGWINFGEYAL